MATPLNSTNFGYFAFKPTSPLLSETDQQKALALSIVMGIFTAGIGHLISSIVYAVKQSEMNVLLAEKNMLLEKVEETRRSVLKNLQLQLKLDEIFTSIENNFGSIMERAKIADFEGGAVIYKIQSDDEIKLLKQFRFPKFNDNMDALACIREDIAIERQAIDAKLQNNNLKMDGQISVVCAIVVKKDRSKEADAPLYSYFKERSRFQEDGCCSTEASGSGTSLSKVLEIIKRDFPCRFDESNFLGC